MPALGKVDGQVSDFIAIAGSQEGFPEKVLRFFAGALNQLAKGVRRGLFKMVGAVGGGPARPLRLKGLGGNRL